MIRRGIWLLVFTLGTQCLTAQRYNFKFFGEDNGLNNLAVEAVLQDRAGFLWAGTQNGLYRYDGSGFTTFDRSSGLPGTRIEVLHESSDGTLWVATDAGIARRVQDHFEAVPFALGSSQEVRALVTQGHESVASDHSGR